jgi:metal-sulfur cluster biosynthetic enzyme
MFIQTEATADPARLKFLPDRQVLSAGAVELRGRMEAAVSPLAERLFAISGIASVSLSKDSITITKASGDWQHLKPAIFGVIMEHFMSGAPILRQSTAPEGLASASLPDDDQAVVVERIKDALRRVIDPELGCKIVDLGLVYDVVMEENGIVRIIMTTTTPGCPATNYLKQGAGDAAGDVQGVKFVEVTLTYEPRWTPEMISSEGKAHLGIRDGGRW